MKTSKNFLAMLLCLLLAGSAVSCGESETGGDPDTMVPEYYSVALKTKYVRDSDNDKALQIIDMIRNGATTDLGFLLSNKLNRVGVVLHDCIRAGHANYASTYAAAEPAAKNLLAEMLEK